MNVVFAIRAINQKETNNMILNTTIHAGVPVVNISEVGDIYDTDQTVATIDFSILGDKRLSLQLNLDEVNALATQLSQTYQAIMQGNDDAADAGVR